MATSQSTTAILCLCAAVATYVGLKQRGHRKQLPPGPKKLPIIGNVLDMPRQEEWKTFARWSKEYDSDIIHVEALGNDIVILNSYKRAVDILDKRSGVYSSRPHMTMFHELSGYGYGFAMLPYGNIWRASRRMFTRHLGPTNPKLNQPREIKYVKQMLLNLLHEPEHFMSHIRYVVGASAISMIYGLPIQAKNDPYLEAAETVVRIGVELMIPGAFLVDTFPFLKHIPTWFPGTYFHKAAARMQAAVPLVREFPFAATEKMKANGGYDPCFVTNVLEEFESLHESVPTELLELIKDVAGQGFIGAADTTVSAIGTFFLAMVLYPDVQAKAQAELDEVLRGGLPDHSDLPNLPYLSAIAREVYRWHPILPMGVPHVLTSDDHYEGYMIPSGSIVIPNHWAMCYDEEMYPEPHIFRPERHFKEGKFDSTVLDPTEISFGFGRRACPGRHLAHSLLTLTMGSVLASFNLQKKLDEEGKEITPKEEYHLAPLCQPLAFPCTIVPRSAEVASQIEACSSEFS